MFFKPQNIIAIIVILAITVSEMATDIFVPSLPTLTRYFSTSEEVVSLTLSFYLLGFSISGPVYGPLSDAYGRRPIFLFGTFVFVITSLLCAFASHIEMLVVLRTLQGVGAGAAIVVGMAIVKDLYDGEDCAKIMTLMGIVMSASPGLAPLLGGYIAQAYGWPAVFIVMFVVALFIYGLLTGLLKESHPKTHRQPLSLKTSVMNYDALFLSPQYMKYALMCSLTFGAIWSYISATTFYFIDELGFSLESYGYFQAFLVAGYILGSVGNNILLGRMPVRKVLHIGVLSLSVSGMLLILGTLFYPDSAYMITLGMLPVSISASLVFPNAATLSLEVFPEKSGSAAALLSFCEMAVSSLMIILTQLIYFQDFLPVAMAMCVLCMIVGAMAFIPSDLARKNQPE